MNQDTVKRRKTTINFATPGQLVSRLSTGGSKSGKISAAPRRSVLKSPSKSRVFGQQRGKTTPKKQLRFSLEPKIDQPKKSISQSPFKSPELTSLFQATSGNFKEIHRFQKEEEKEQKKSAIHYPKVVENKSKREKDLHLTFKNRPIEKLKQSYFIKRKYKGGDLLLERNFRIGIISKIRVVADTGMTICVILRRVHYKKMFLQVQQVLKNKFRAVWRKFKLFDFWQLRNRLDELINLIIPVCLDQGEFLYQKGQKVENVYLLLEGEVELRKQKEFDFESDDEFKSETDQYNKNIIREKKFKKFVNFKRNLKAPSLITLKDPYEAESELYESSCVVKSCYAFFMKLSKEVIRRDVLHVSTLFLEELEADQRLGGWKDTSRVKQKLGDKFKLKVSENEKKRRLDAAPNYKMRDYERVPTEIKEEFMAAYNQESLRYAFVSKVLKNKLAGRAPGSPLAVPEAIVQANEPHNKANYQSRRALDSQNEGKKISLEKSFGEDSRILKDPEVDKAGKTIPMTGKKLSESLKKTNHYKFKKFRKRDQQYYKNVRKKVRDLEIKNKNKLELKFMNRAEVARTIRKSEKIRLMKRLNKLNHLNEKAGINSFIKDKNIEFLEKIDFESEQKMKGKYMPSVAAMSHMRDRAEGLGITPKNAIIHKKMDIPKSASRRLLGVGRGRGGSPGPMGVSNASVLSNNDMLDLLNAENQAFTKTMNSLMNVSEGEDEGTESGQREGARTGRSRRRSSKQPIFLGKREMLGEHRSSHFELGVSKRDASRAELSISKARSSRNISKTLKKGPKIDQNEKREKMKIMEFGGDQATPGPSRLPRKGSTVVKDSRRFSKLNIRRSQTKNPKMSQQLFSGEKRRTKHSFVKSAATELSSQLLRANSQRFLQILEPGSRRSFLASEAYDNQDHLEKERIKEEKEQLNRNLKLLYDQTDQNWDKLKKLLTQGNQLFEFKRRPNLNGKAEEDLYYHEMMVSLLKFNILVQTDHYRRQAEAFARNINIQPLAGPSPTSQSKAAELKMVQYKMSPLQLNSLDLDQDFNTEIKECQREELLDSSSQGSKRPSDDADRAHGGSNELRRSSRMLRFKDRYKVSIYSKGGDSDALSGSGNSRMHRENLSSQETPKNNRSAGNSSGGRNSPERIAKLRILKSRSSGRSRGSILSQRARSGSSHSSSHFGKNAKINQKLKKIYNEEVENEPKIEKNEENVEKIKKNEGDDGKIQNLEGKEKIFSNKIIFKTLEAQSRRTPPRRGRGHSSSRPKLRSVRSGLGMSYGAKHSQNKNSNSSKFLPPNGQKKPKIKSIRTFKMKNNKNQLFKGSKPKIFDQKKSEFFVSKKSFRPSGSPQYLLKTTLVSPNTRYKRLSSVRISKVTKKDNSGSTTRPTIRINSKWSHPSSGRLGTTATSKKLFKILKSGENKKKILRARNEYFEQTMLSRSSKRDIASGNHARNAQKYFKNCYERLKGKKPSSSKQNRAESMYHPHSVRSSADPGFRATLGSGFFKKRRKDPGANFGFLTVNKFHKTTLGDIDDTVEQRMQSARVKKSSLRIKTHQ